MLKVIQTTQKYTKIIINHDIKLINIKNTIDKNIKKDNNNNNIVIINN